MSTNNKTINLVLPSLLLSACVLSSTSYADGIGIMDNWYVGGNVGLSKFDPDENNSNWNSTDDSDVSKGVYIGKDINSRFGIEAFWNEFGDVAYESTSGKKGEINYKGYGANIIYNSPYKLGSLKPFAKLGVAKLKTTDKKDISSTQLNTTSVIAGIGVEQELTDKLSLRAEYNYYDKDLNNLSVGLNWTPNYHVHKHNRIKPVVVKKAVLKPVVKKAVAKPKPRVVYKKVYVNKPAPKAKPQYQVMHRNLAGGSNFNTGSAELTFIGQNTLNRLINDIKNQRVNVQSLRVVGHTDSVGTRQSNQYLSMNRANTVANYLSTRGINRSIIQTMGRGESQPIASNKTGHGKARNRRVEIAVYGTSRVRIK